MRTIIEFKNNILFFENPLKIISCSELEKVPECFALMEESLASGFFLAGFLSYEAGYAFEDSFKKPALSNQLCASQHPAEKICSEKQDFPVVFMGVYKSSSKKIPSSLKSVSREYGISKIELNIPQKNYFKNIEAIRSYIAKGDVYQITYCIKFNFNFNGDAYSLYKNLKKDQPVPYPAYIEAEDFSILSLSPELFMKKTDDFILTKPMKGTWRRGENIWQDICARFKLKYDSKNRAENVMIADLLRNDLGRIAEGIRAPVLFEVDGYKTLYQMTSTVTGKIRRDIPLLELFKSLHPSGSVTGAPKIRAMEIIRELENEPRRIYTGAIGYITPQKDLFFNVPIRTILIRNNKAEVGIGGGIVWDSTPEGEFDECMLKAKFLLDHAH